MANITLTAAGDAFLECDTQQEMRETGLGIWLNTSNTNTLTISGGFAITLTASGATNVTLPTSGTLVSTASTLAVFAATTSAQLAGIISDETGSGSLVFGTSPTLAAPTCTGNTTVATINKLTLTTPANGSTLTIVDGKTLTVSKTLTLTSPTDNNTITFPDGGGTAVMTSGAQTITDKTFTAPIINGATMASPAITSASLITPTVYSSFLPNSNDALALGAAATAFSDLFLASGAVIGFASGNMVLTHSSGVLTASTGDIRVTTAGTNTASVVTVGGTQTLTGKTLDSPTLTTPDLGSASADSLSVANDIVCLGGVEAATLYGRPLPTLLSGDGAIALTTGPKIITKNSAALLSVAAPSSQDGETLTILSATAFSHVVTFTGTTLYDGTAGANLTATFDAQPGAAITVVAYAATWLLQSSHAVTIAP